MFEKESQPRRRPRVGLFVAIGLIAVVALGAGMFLLTKQREAEASWDVRQCANTHQFSLPPGTVELGAWNAALLDCWRICKASGSGCISGPDPRETSNWNHDAVAAGPQRAASGPPSAVPEVTTAPVKTISTSTPRRTTTTTTTTTTTPKEQLRASNFRYPAGTGTLNDFYVTGANAGFDVDGWEISQMQRRYRGSAALLTDEWPDLPPDQDLLYCLFIVANKPGAKLADGVWLKDLVDVYAMDVNNPSNSGNVRDYEFTPRGQLMPLESSRWKETSTPRAGRPIDRMTSLNSYGGLSGSSCYHVPNELWGDGPLFVFAELNGDWILPIYD